MGIPGVFIEPAVFKRFLQKRPQTVRAQVLFQLPNGRYGTLASVRTADNRRIWYPPWSDPRPRTTGGTLPTARSSEEVQERYP